MIELATRDEQAEMMNKLFVAEKIVLKDKYFHLLKLFTSLKWKPSATGQRVI